jgi:uncharacterized protein (TIGR02246 family)
MRTRTIPAIGVSSGLLALIACSQGNTPPGSGSDTRIEDAAQVRAAAAKWENAIGARNLDAILAVYTDDAWQLAELGPIARTPDERRAFWQAVESQPVVNDTVNVADRITVARSGDLAVQYGEFRQIISDKAGASTSLPQKFMNTWRKQADGSWKVSASMSTVKN